MNVLAVVENDDDVRGLIRMLLSPEPEFVIEAETNSAEEALVLLRSSPDIGLIVLDHSLTGMLDGIKAAPLLKEILPQAKIILFTAHENLKRQAASEPAIDVFLLKTHFAQLLPTARRLCGLGT